MFPIKDNIPTRSYPKATRRLILICIAVFLLEISLEPQKLSSVFQHYGLVPQNVQNNLIHFSFFSHMFLHGGWMHLIGNLWTLWIFGDNVEDRMSPLRFAIFYTVCGIGAAALQIYMSPDSNIPMVGASGAISGVLGAYFLLYPQAKVLVMIPIFFIPQLFSVSAFFYVGFWFLIQFISGAFSHFAQTQGGIAWWAHIGGFVTGVFSFWIFLRRKRSRSR